ncbi:MAG: polyamine aminopropyltransferase [Moorellales bacterium]
MKGLWFTELQTPTVAISCRVKQTLHWEKTPYQELAVLDTEPFGRMLTLDGVIQTTVGDEFVYHEMITWVVLSTHPHPQRVLIIGGGDGGALREVLKHPEVESATLVEIDRRVTEVCRQYLPEIAGAFNDPRATVLFEDGILHVQEHPAAYDVIIIDSTDPVGPAEGLFSAEFYRNAYRALRDDGVFVAQTESPFFNRDLLARIYRDVSGVFPVCRLYLAPVPTYPGGLWTFTVGSKRFDPAVVEPRMPQGVTTRYYNPAVHRAAFALPNFVRELIGS